MQLTEEQKKIRNKIYSNKYKQSKKGKEAQKRANEKYQQSEKYKNYKKEYYRSKKNNDVKIEKNVELSI